MVRATQALLERHVGKGRGVWKVLGTPSFPPPALSPPERCGNLILSQTWSDVLCKHSNSQVCQARNSAGQQSTSQSGLVQPEPSMWELLSVQPPRLLELHSADYLTQDTFASQSHEEQLLRGCDRIKASFESKWNRD